MSKKRVAQASGHSLRTRTSMELFKGLIMNQTDLATLLKENVVEVTFTKADGEQRVMPCTLKESLLPPALDTKETKSKENKDPNLFKVFCTDKQQWRSFRFERLISYKIVE